MAMSRMLQLVRQKRLHRCVPLGHAVMSIYTCSDAKINVHPVFYFPK